MVEERVVRDYGIGSARSFWEYLYEKGREFIGVTGLMVYTLGSLWLVIRAFWYGFAVAPVLGFVTAIVAAYLLLWAGVVLYKIIAGILVLVFGLAAAAGYVWAVYTAPLFTIPMTAGIIALAVSDRQWKRHLEAKEQARKEIAA